MHRKKLKNVRPTSQSNARTSQHGGESSVHAQKACAVSLSHYPASLNHTTYLNLRPGLDFSSTPVYPHLINRVKKVMNEKDLQAKIR